MKLQHSPLVRINPVCQFPPALLAALLLCILPAAAKGQSVTFTGAQLTLPASGLENPLSVAVDSAGDVFISEEAGNFTSSAVVELPRTAGGYGPQVTIPT